MAAWTLTVGTYEGATNFKPLTTNITSRQCILLTQAFVYCTNKILIANILKYVYIQWTYNIIIFVYLAASFVIILSFDEDALQRIVSISFTTHIFYVTLLHSYCSLPFFWYYNFIIQSFCIVHFILRFNRLIFTPIFFLTFHVFCFLHSNLSRKNKRIDINGDYFNVNNQRLLE